jgi:hypothetical protein
MESANPRAWEVFPVLLKCINRVYIWSISQNQKISTVADQRRQPPILTIMTIILMIGPATSINGKAKIGLTVFGQNIQSPIGIMKITPFDHTVRIVNWLGYSSWRTLAVIFPFRTNNSTSKSTLVTKDSQWVNEKIPWSMECCYGKQNFSLFTRSCL